MIYVINDNRVPTNDLDKSEALNYYFTSVTTVDNPWSDISNDIQL